MSLTLHDLTIPILTRALNEQISFLKIGEKWCEETSHPKENLLAAQLASDMKPLPFQIQRCSDAAKALIARIAGGENVSIADDEKTFEDLYARLQKTIDLLENVKREDFVANDHPVRFSVASKDFEFTALSYVQRFLLPNFFFHQTAAYLILRNAGVPVGKKDFLGWETLMEN